MRYKVNVSFYTALCLSNWLKGISFHFEVHAITWKFKPFFLHIMNMEMVSVMAIVLMITEKKVLCLWMKMEWTECFDKLLFCASNYGIIIKNRTILIENCLRNSWQEYATMWHLLVVGRDFWSSISPKKADKKKSAFFFLLHPFSDKRWIEVEDSFLKP
jgi:hypothetical protein